MQTNEIRRKFLDFFKKNGHQIVPSDSLIPAADPSLLFTSAGMVQFKKHFLGQTKLDFTRAASAQKCLRTSDIERVGLTARHLTFFEMLGNFSFGDYFKKEAIAWSWEFLTQEVNLNPQRLYASVYKEDDEALELWKTILPESRIVRLGEDTNFWTMGPTGPCGPCSEILYDRGEKYSQDHVCPGPGCDCDRYIEVWNLVFTQFDRKADGKLDPLPQKNIDTGMGLERLSVVVNDLESAYSTDLFKNLITAIRKKIGTKSSDKIYRIISDHIRACTFLIGDGVLPSNEGRGYVLRRLLRRGLREAWTQGLKEPFLNQLVQVVVQDMGDAYPELTERAENIRSIIENEEKNTLETIGTGTKTLEDEIKKVLGQFHLKPPVGKISLSGEKVFYIYDTYGLDKEIQKEIIKDLGGELLFSEQEYLSAKEKAVETARKGWKGSGERDVTIYSTLQKKVGTIIFIGYETLKTETKVLALLKEEQANGKSVLRDVKELHKDEEGEIVLAETPFYAESGGQAGDQGQILDAHHSVMAEVLDTQEPVEGLIVHRIKVSAEKIREGDKISAHVNESLRKNTMRHHTATHLLHAALRRVLGPQVTQAGSLVAPEKLRFDFTYPRSLTEDQILAIERGVNQAVLSNVQRKRAEHSLEEARKQGALAFFGDKYGSKVFVVNYGNYSTEVCGGTHCHSTGEIGLFKIVSETSVGSGVRRIEALAGEKALEFVQKQEKNVQQILTKLKVSPDQLSDKIDKLLQRQTELEREITSLKKKSMHADLDEIVGRAQVLKGSLKWVVDQVPFMDLQSLRETADMIRNKLGSGIVLLATTNNEKISFVVTATKDCIEKGIRAGKVAQDFSKAIGGSGGGKDTFAQGGGEHRSDLAEILDAFKNLPL